MSNTNNVSLFTKSTNTQSGNLGGVKSPGHKKMQNQFIVSHAGSNKSGISYVKTSTRTTISEQGNISTGALDSDIAIEGSGMLLVSKTATGEKVFTRRGDFQKDQSGYWKNGGDMLLLAWKLGTDGKLPTNSTLLSSLEVVNFANVKGTPVATTTVSLAMNLDGRETTKSIRGAGFTAGLKTSGLNNTTGKSDKNDIILPEKLANSGSLKIGDSFTFKSEPTGTQKTMVYGGIATSNLASVTNDIYGARRASDPFVQGVAPNGIPQGSTLTIN
jgi:flagellar hook protein FlgE